MPLFRRKIDEAEQAKVKTLIARVFDGNRKIDTAKTSSLHIMATDPRGIASEAYEEARQQTADTLSGVMAQLSEPGFWPILEDGEGIRKMTDLRSALHDCHRHQLLELHAMGSAAKAFRSGMAHSPLSEGEIRAAQKAFEKALDKLGSAGAKLARHYRIPHQELQSIV